MNNASYHISYITVKLGQESCSKADRCPEGMVCQSGVCACQMGTMTDDRKFCLKSNEKLLGSYCTPSVNTCFQLSGNWCMPSFARHLFSRMCMEQKMFNTVNITR